MTLEEAVKNVSAVRFTAASPSEIRKFSVVEVTAPETYDEDGMPVQGGLMDNRLGTLEPGQKCATCGNTTARCTGHFGRIELAQPVLHIAFVNDVYKLLISTCRSCSRLLVPQDELDGYLSRKASSTNYMPTLDSSIAAEILARAKKNRKSQRCPHCNKEQYEIEFTKPTMFHEITEDGGYARLLPVAIRERLERILNADLELLGYDPNAARPEWFVLQALPVPPVAVRPSITLESGLRSEDDLTHKIVDILRVNQRVMESKESGSPPLIVQDLVDLLQYHVTTYFDNEVSGLPQAHHRSGRPLKTLSQRLKGKEGRFRGSLSGKRVDFSSRTVISPDPSLRISEVGIPMDVAKRLTIPETISPWNLDRLKQLVIRGPFEHQGANYVIRPDGVKIRLDYVSDRQALAEMIGPGFVVERHLADGDVVIFNRQPSLHRISIMAHSVRVLPYKTFRLHPAVCPPYNADFDGDEMNLHVPQSQEARSEALSLMRVQDQMLSPRYGGPIIGAIRDYLTSAYLLTKDETWLTKDEFTNLASAGGYVGPLPQPGKREPEELYSGKQLFSLFLPKGFSYVMTSKWARGGRKRVQNDVVIRDGQMISGVIDRAAVGAEEPDSILHRIAKDYGPDATSKFLDSILLVLKSYITRVGFSFGIDELMLPEHEASAVVKSIDVFYQRIEEFFRSYKEGTLKLERGLSPEQALEYNIVNELAEARDRAGREADKAFVEGNAGVIMARTGARGSLLNLGQMTACLGQQSIRGRRIEKGYHERALSQFERGDRTPDARGFVKSNYRDGLNPVEFFFHAMGGREGLVDTAVRTQQSGYMQRRLVNALEHLRVEYDLTVRDPFGNIIEFLYGEDGVDPAKSDHGKSVNARRLVEIEALLRADEPPALKEEITSFLAKYEGKFNKLLTEELEETAADVKLSAKGLERVLGRVQELLELARIEPGEAVGMVAAQSIGEPGTQMTLRTFHFAGVKERDVTLGLPRLIELVDARKQPRTPSMNVYVKKPYSSGPEGALELARKLLLTRVGDLVVSSRIDFSDASVKLYFDQRLLQERGCTLEEAATVIGTGKRRVQVNANENMLTIRTDGADALALASLRNKVLNSKVKGITGISRVTIAKEGQEWMIQTSGSNLAKVLEVEGVDATRTTTDNVYEISQTLGIEAAREAMIREIMGTLEEQGLEVDVRHITLVADVMTCKGFLQQIGRHGIAGTKTSVLARAAFEITVPTLAEAAANGEVEELKGVTENVIVGLPIPVGTGMIDLFMKG